MDMANEDERRLSELSPAEWRQHLMQLPVKRRLEAIVQRTDAEAVVASMAVQDFYFSVQELGAEDALPLLALSQVKQLNHLFDLEWWRKEEIQPAKAITWLERLARAGEEKLLAWLAQADFELLVVLFKQWLVLSIAPDDEDPLEAQERLPKNTLDDLYFWEVRYPQYEDFIRRLLGLLFEANYGFYRELLNSVLWATNVEVEEDAYRFHQARLQDEAIPEFYEALEIYRAIRPDDIPADKAVREDEPTTRSTPAFALVLIPEQDLLARTLRAIHDARLMDTLQLEMASLANKVVVADQLPPDKADALHFAVQKAAAYVNLGLELKSAGDPRAARQLLRDVFLEYLFRLGQTQVAQLRNRLQRVVRQGWLSRWPGGLKMLDDEWAEAAGLLLEKTPQLRIPAPEHGSRPQREELFKTQAQLFQGKHLIDVIIAMGKLFEALDVHPDQLIPRLWRQGQISAPEEITLGSLIWTAAARSRMEGGWGVEPIPVSRWPELFPLVQPADMERTIREWVERVMADKAWSALAQSYLDPLFRTYAEEISPFAQKGETPDSALMRYFLFTKA